MCSCSKTFRFSNPIEEDPALPKCFPLEELGEATQNLGRDNIVGMGGFGAVYWESLANGSQVAIKRAENLTQGTEK
ncbi:hypothetical protein ACJRO7_007479 [Eucalyptus globulus]|uniref:Protein kinase domain-containing protein n=1 Tax=Eucalyptus globulus TaxID=34317 RepID=A0ABD3ILB2_EUCGL